MIGLPALTYLGFFGGVEGALYVVKFFVWATSVPVGLIALTDTMQKKLAEQPPKGRVVRFIDRTVSWCMLAMMVWTGHLATATAWGFFMLCAAVARASADEIRATAEGSAP